MRARCKTSGLLSLRFHALLLLTLLWAGTGVTWGAEPISGYPDQFSTTVGEPVIVRLAALPDHPGSSIDHYDIYDALTEQVVASSNSAVPLAGATCASHQGKGCEYPTRITLNKMPPKAGLYYVVVHDNLGFASAPIYLNRKPPIVPNRKLPSVAVVFPSFTWQAYNETGGGSFYRPLKEMPNKVSTARPFLITKEPFPIQSSLVFVKELARAGQPVLILDSLDIHRHPEYLEQVPVLVLNVHDEYWTVSMLKHLFQFLERGGFVAVFGGNTMYRAITYQDGVIHKVSVMRNKGAISGGATCSAPGFIRSPNWASHGDLPAFH